MVCNMRISNKQMDLFIKITTLIVLNLINLILLKNVTNINRILLNYSMMVFIIVQMINAAII